MLISENWLREWVNPQLSTQKLADTLTMAGLEVDSITPQSAQFDNVIVAQVESVQPHPNSDRLNLCQLVDGNNEHHQVVCGASNVQAGIKVPLALLGATLPNDVKICKTEIRGVESSGMICSASELGLAEKSEGIMHLDESAVLGACVANHLQLDDQIIELELTPNRGDCLGMLGVARELAALTQATLKPLNIDSVAAQTQARLPVRIEAGIACPRYVARIIESINPQAQTPDWMKEKLRRSGVRPISAIVDITNFVMIELGQPMHAFDLENISQEIIVRYARQDEKLTLLDEKQLSLNVDDLLICDHDRPVALAGIMGGLGSGISDQTSTVLLESAYFTQKLIIGKARRIGMQTDASYRFERGVDPNLQKVAIQRATQLITDICGGQPGPVIEVTDEQHIPVKQTVDVRFTQINKVIGIEITAEDARHYLSSLGCDVRMEKTALQVLPPSFRFDLDYEHDLIEEVARLYGYNRIPENTPIASVHGAGTSESKIIPSRIRNLMIDRGYQETISYSFVDPTLQSKFNDSNHPIKLANPISENLSEMRLSMLPGLLNCLINNYQRQHRQIKLFELGNVYNIVNNQRVEDYCLGVILTGFQTPEQWGTHSRPVDFYDLKSDLEAVTMLTGQLDQFEFRAKSLAGFHPGRCAGIFSDNEEVGFIGQLRPSTVSSYDVDQEVYCFQMNLNGILNSSIPQYIATSKYPSTRRDLSVIVDQGIMAQQVLAEVKDSAGSHLVDLKLFDVYTGKPIDSAQKSISLGLTFQALERTLTEKEMDETCQRVMEQLKHKFNAKLRE